MCGLQGPADRWAVRGEEVSQARNRRAHTQAPGRTSVLQYRPLLEPVPAAEPLIVALQIPVDAFEAVPSQLGPGHHLLVPLLPSRPPLSAPEGAVRVGAVPAPDAHQVHGVESTPPQLERNLRYARVVGHGSDQRRRGGRAVDLLRLQIRREPNQNVCAACGLCTDTDDGVNMCVWLWQLLLLVRPLLPRRPGWCEGQMLQPACRREHLVVALVPVRVGHDEPASRQMPDMGAQHVWLADEDEQQQGPKRHRGVGDFVF